MTKAAGNVLHRLFAGGRVLCDGAMGTMLLARGVPLERCYDELNLSRPELIASLHAAYLDAGAEVIEANTFGANAYRLARHGLREKVRAINLAGVRVARKSVAAREGCVAGAIGPLGVDVRQVRSEELRAAFVEQVSALVDGGVDLLMIETMTSLAEACEALRAVRAVAPGARAVVMMTVDDQGNCLDGSTVEEAAVRLTDLGADAVGCNCSMGPASVLGAVRRMRAVTRLPLAAMPSAGIPGGPGPMATPDEFASFAEQFFEAGASLIGGCCGTTPSHTRAMRSIISTTVPPPPPKTSKYSKQNT